MERVSKGLFLCSLVVVGLLYGSIGAMYGWFPHPQVRQAETAWLEFSSNWRNDLALEPTRHLVPAGDPDRDPFTIHRPELISDGYVMVAGLIPGQEFLQGVVLYDRDGEVVHRWTIDYEMLDSEGKSEFNVLLHGIEAFPDGSVVAAFDAGNVLARFRACGGTDWVLNGNYHHVVEAGDDGTLWTWRSEQLVQLDAATGRELDAFGLRKDVIEAHDLHGSLAIRTVEHKGSQRYVHDPFHTNDVEALPVSMAEAFPMFEAGDLLVSLRELNLVGVIDPDTRMFKWYRHGPWFKQHDPDFQPDGTITVYDNRMGLGSSRLIAIDPATDRWATLLTDTEATPFYSWRRGKHQVLESGHYLVTESERGRIFEVTADGELVWERHMIHDAEHNAIVTSADYYPPTFFDDDAFDCAPAAS